MPHPHTVWHTPHGRPTELTSAKASLAAQLQQAASDKTQLQSDLSEATTKADSLSAELEGVKGAASKADEAATMARVELEQQLAQLREAQVRNVIWCFQPFYQEPALAVMCAVHTIERAVWPCGVLGAGNRVCLSSQSTHRCDCASVLCCLSTTAPNPSGW